MDDIKLWLPPMLTLLGTLIVVTFTAWLNTRSFQAMIDALRHEMRADHGALRLDMTTAMGALKLDIQRVENNLDYLVQTQARRAARQAGTTRLRNADVTTGRDTRPRV